MKPSILGVVFLLGGVAGGMGAQFVVPPARAGTSPTRFEYLCRWPEEGSGMRVADMNRAGSEGWELVTMTLVANQAVTCFKRPLP